MKTETVSIIGMSCGHCVMSVEKELRKLPAAEIQVQLGSAKVTFDETKMTEREIYSAIEEAGYQVA
jgi:copper chaperone